MKYHSPPKNLFYNNMLITMLRVRITPLCGNGMAMAIRSQNKAELDRIIV